MKLKRIDPLSSIAAPIETPPPNTNTIEIVDFLRRLASMLSGGRNAEMLLEAADTIERLDRRAALAEQRFQEQQEDHARNLELREAAELASDNLVGEVNSLKAQFAESEAKAEQERGYFAEEAKRLAGVADEARTRVAEANDRLLRVNAEIEELRNPPQAAIDESIAIVPVESLQLARTQFGYLAQGFAKNGDVVSQTICEIGARAIDKALAGDKPAS
jgi:small-conductance mechanosensitive channel